MERQFREREGEGEAEGEGGRERSSRKARIGNGVCVRVCVK